MASRKLASASRDLLGLKTSGYFPINRERGDEAHQALVVLVDPATGKPRAFVNASAITAIRTAAVSAVATRLLARSGSRTLAILGAHRRRRFLRRRRGFFELAKLHAGTARRHFVTAALRDRR